ncbi:hypothetical protein VHUM_00021 [Vanrija humicola]|uniref:Band 7 domain-containing protein n=1 Tax=Vanrija humicola TaxID=5417 RepID=A0A7D8Z2T4_VANHU|nr:hypothetical protein VHUM_00021 [Vanrija humicola]
MSHSPHSHNGDHLDGATVIGANDQAYALNKQASASSSSKQYLLPPAPQRAPPAARAENLPFVDTSSYLDEKRDLLVKIGKGGVAQALHDLDTELKNKGHTGIISDKRPHQFIGREVNPGSFGLYEFASGPKLILEPGRYPGLPLSNWIGCTWHGTYDIATNFPPLKNEGSLMVPDPYLAKLGLTVVQVSQNQAAVCVDPQMRVFVVSDGGFVAMATSGAYRVLGLVDQTHLRDEVKDHYSGQVLGHTQVVKFPGKGDQYVAATFVDIPANNVAILQRKEELFELGAGQHYLTAANVTIRGFFTKGEVQQELQCDNLYTRDQVPVWLRIYLRFQLLYPLQLARHGYPTPFDALQDKTRSILTQIVAHLDYSAMARTRNAAPDVDIAEHAEDDSAGAIFVSAVRMQAIDELKVVASEYGIKLEDLAIIDRRFKGEIAAKLDSLTTRALEAQVESANLDRENANKRRKQEGDAKVLELQNAMKRATAETDAQNTIQAARAKAESALIQAEADAKAIKVRAEAQAQAVRVQAAIDAEIRDDFARGLAKSRVEVERTRAFGSRTVFAPIEAYQSGGMVGMGMVAGSRLVEDVPVRANGSK